MIRNAYKVIVGGSPIQQNLFLILVVVLLVFPLVVALLAVPRLIRASRKLRRVESIGQGYCPECRYDLTGGIEANCQECGYEFSKQERRRLDGIAPGLAKKRERGE